MKAVELTQAWPFYPHSTALRAFHTFFFGRLLGEYSGLHQVYKSYQFLLETSTKNLKQEIKLYSTCIFAIT
jgi:hypothetical protein